jgi:hypothetical protein
LQNYDAGAINRATLSQRMMADPVVTVKARVLVVDEETLLTWPPTL